MQTGSLLHSATHSTRYPTHCSVQSFPMMKSSPPFTEIHGPSRENVTVIRRGPRGRWIPDPEDIRRHSARHRSRFYDERIVEMLEQRLQQKIYSLS